MQLAEAQTLGRAAQGSEAILAETESRRKGEESSTQDTNYLLHVVCSKQATFDNFQRFFEMFCSRKTDNRINLKRERGQLAAEPQATIISERLNVDHWTSSISSDDPEGEPAMKTKTKSEDPRRSERRRLRPRYRCSSLCLVFVDSQNSIRNLWNALRRVWSFCFFLNKFHCDFLHASHSLRCATLFTSSLLHFEELSSSSPSSSSWSLSLIFLIFLDNNSSLSRARPDPGKGRSSLKLLANGLVNFWSCLGLRCYP